jgi:hypothetical protein
MVPSKETPRVGARGYKSSLDWATQMVSMVSHWLQRSWVCVADGGYGSDASTWRFPPGCVRQENAKFGYSCRRHGVSLVARLPWKANLYDFAPTSPPRRLRGRPRTKGSRQLSMQQQLDAVIPIAPHTTAWYAKSDLTFADLLAAVRCSLWQSHLFSRPSLPPSLALFSDTDREHLIQLLASPF